MVENRRIEEDEIDLRELFKTLLKNKKFIIVFTTLVTLFAIVYAYMKTPIYEVKSVVRLGTINNKLIIEPKTLEEKLKIMYGIQFKNQKLTDTNAIVSDVSLSKKVNEFLIITTQATTNELALKKNNEVVSYIKNRYKYQIDEFLLQTKVNISNFEQQLDHIEKVEKVDLKNKIKRIKEQDISKIDQKISLLRKQDIDKIEEKINLIKTQDIVKIQKEVSFIKDVSLNTIDNKLKFNKEKLKEYEKLTTSLLNKKSSNDTENVLISMQLLNMQTLILDIQNKIETLKKERRNILEITLFDLKQKIKNLKEITIKDLEKKKNNIVDVQIKNLELQKKNLLEINITNLKNQLEINLKDKVKKLKDKIIFENLKTKKEHLRNSEIVGDILVNDYPIKPKKKLIVVVAFVTGFILSIFLVFLLEFIRNFKEEEKTKND